MTAQIRSTTSARLAELGYDLPAAAAPAANYVPFVQSGNLLFISGQLPMGSAGLTQTGKVGADVSVDQAVVAARQCGLNLIAQMQAATGNLDLVHRIVRLGGFVNCTDGFSGQPEVINGASDLMVAVFGAARGAHARAAVGVNALPRDATVEVDAIVELTTVG